MVRRISISQYRARLRQAQQKQKQALNKFNQSIRKYNRDVKSAVDKYNRDVRTHNARVRAHQQRVRAELKRFSRSLSSSTSQRVIVFRKSTEHLHQAYSALVSRADSSSFGANYDRILDLSERETANGLEVANRLLDTDDFAATPAGDLVDSELRDALREISPDLDDRWNGAIFSLNPSNPDAARHFCTSAREVLTSILELKAPDADVFAALPDCDKTDRGNPTRRSRIRYFLHRKSMLDAELEEFIESDMENIIQLFPIFNDGTHGSAGRFTQNQLQSIRRRVEHGIKFLTEIID